ncbi:MAG: hypothetical protein HC813_01830 [Planctomycetes bacterium]|nr:hypothetical protein [Planctomycetota bacterium]
MRTREGGKLEHLRGGLVQVVGGLGRGPDGDATVGFAQGEGRVLLHRQVGVALVEDRVLQQVVGALKGGRHVPELHAHALVHVAVIAVVVDRRRAVRDRLLGREAGARGS